MELHVTDKNKRKIFIGMYVSGVIYIALLVLLFVMLSSLDTIVHPIGPILSVGIISLYFLVVDIGLGFYLYKEYMHCNQNSSLSIDPLNRQVSYKNNSGDIINAAFGDIKRINVYIPPNNYRNTITFTSMEDFSYARFELNSGKEFYVTCLMIPRLKLKDFILETFPETPVDFHRWWVFPSIRLVNYCRRTKKLE